MLNKTWYEKKRDDMYRAYRAALEMEDMVAAARFFTEYENYKMLAN